MNEKLNRRIKARLHMAVFLRYCENQYAGPNRRSTH
jgi:hypothetical protein